MEDLIVKNCEIITLDTPQIMSGGYLSVKDGKINKIGQGKPFNLNAETEIDVEGRLVMPPLVDCHTHLMEFASPGVHNTFGEAQKMAGIANLLTALKSGIIFLGEHFLGHPDLSSSGEMYWNIINEVPINIKLAFGCCTLGTNPLTFLSSIPSSKGNIKKEEITANAIKQMAQNTNFPGESIFLNATVANLPSELVPRGGEEIFFENEIRTFIKIFHESKRKIGAHIEGDKTARIFIKNGGDVIHHGHGINMDTGKMIKDAKIALVITPHGGTASCPTSPAEVFKFYQMGIRLAIASDSYLPLHPEANWINLPSGTLIGPDDFLKIASPVLNYFIKKGVNKLKALELITINGLDILGINRDQGKLISGTKANFIVANSIPGIETTDTGEIRYIINEGKVLVNKEK